MNDPVFVHTVACKVDAWTFARVQEEAQRKRQTTSEHIRAILETYHRFPELHAPSNSVNGAILQETEQFTEEANQ